MDYQKIEPNPYSFEAELSRRRGGREGSAGGALFVLAVILGALALVIWLAGSGATPDAADDAAMPAAIQPADSVPATPAVPE